jgi:hypothetical protein
LNELNKGDHRIYDAAGNRPSVEVDLYRVDDLLDRLNVKRVDAIKMDVQGAEALAVEGMSRMLASQPNLRIMMEFWPWAIQRSGRDPAQFLEGFRRAGFQVSEVTDRQCEPRAPSDDKKLLALTRERQHTDLFLQKSASR